MALVETERVEELRQQLSRPLPHIPSRYLYDERGAALYETLIGLEEYYQARTEEALLEAHASDVVECVRPRHLAELGSGAGRKIRLLLDAMERSGRMRSCTLLDINEPILSESIIALRSRYPGLEVGGIRGDFERDLDRLGPGGERLVLFLAGTIGNLHPSAVPGFLERLARQMVPGDGLLVGLDLVKDPAVLEAAYNDREGVTAEFNLNILNAINEQFDADFDLRAFQHRAFWDPEKQWIDIRLRARRATRARVLAADLTLEFDAGDEIRTELSCKYTRASFEAHLGPSNIAVARWYTDAQERFALALLEPGA